MGTSPLEDKNYSISGYEAAVSGVNGQLWACNFLQGEKSAVGTYSFPDTRTGGKENSYKPKNSSGTTYTYNSKTWVNLGVGNTMFTLARPVQTATSGLWTV